MAISIATMNAWSDRWEPKDRMTHSPLEPLRVPAQLWRRLDVDEALSRRDFTALFRLVHKYARGSQTQIGSACGLSQGSVSRIMNGRRTIVTFEVIERIADGFDMPDHARTRLGLAPRAAVRPEEANLSLDLESPAAVLSDYRHQREAQLSDATLDGLDVFLADVVDRYETAGPAVLAPEVVRQRRWVQELLGNCRPSRRGERLVMIAGRLSGQLSYMAVNLGRFASARAYGVEAFELAESVEDRGLQAWVRGTQSLAEYYDGHFERSRTLARDGLRYAGRGPQAVRLLVNGEARAAGKLGDASGVDRAVGRAFELLDRLPPERGMTSCISFGLYSEARVASNAATAYLALGRSAQALHHVRRAAAVVDQSSSIWSKALVRLDQSAALVHAQRPDLERATALARTALELSSGHRIVSIRQRAEELLTALDQWGGEPVVSSFIDEAQDWLRSDPQSGWTGSG